MIKRETRAALIPLVLATLLQSSVCAASTIDWSAVTLSGAFPDFSFVDATLGLVEITYSIDTEIFGIDDALADIDTLLLGNTGGESLTISWANPVNSMNIHIWDIDATGDPGERLIFVSSAVATPVSLHPTDEWDASSQTLSSDLSANPNFDPTNFSIMNFSDPGGFNSITFNWLVSGTGATGVGEIHVIPLPPALYLFAAAVVALFGGGRRLGPIHR